MPSSPTTTKTVPDVTVQRPVNDLLLRASRREPVERTPVWFMRQAGRYLPQYRAIRAKNDFLTLCKTPDLAAEVTIQPVDELDVDAAIIFSDILVVPEAMGMHLVVEEGKGGPQFPSPLRTAADIEQLSDDGVASSLQFVFDAIRTTRQRLTNRVPLIGFSGSPWTLATYMVEGRSSKDFRIVKNLIYSDPRSAHRLLEKLARAVSHYLSEQIRAGAQVIQIFDTWGGILTPDAFREFSLRYIEQIIATVERTDQPVIVFSKDCGYAIEAIAQTGAQVVGLDWKTDIGEARRRTGDRVALQGNLDPAILFSPPEKIVEEVGHIMQKFGNGSGHIFNLGHGILPDTPVEHARAFVRAVKEFSPQYHQS